MDKKEELCLRGSPICSGVAIASPFIFSYPEEHVPEFSVPKEDIEHEVERYYAALRNSRKDLLLMQRKLKRSGGSEAVDILRAHLAITHDPLMTHKVESEIRKKGKNSESVFDSVIGEYQQRFSRIDDSFFQERVQDFRDITRRILRHLNKKERKTLQNIAKPCIVFAHELSPSDTAEAEIAFIEAFVTRSGSETSHVAIIARARGIPFVSKVDFPPLSEDDLIVVDGKSGAVLINPYPDTLAYYKEEQSKVRLVADHASPSEEMHAETADGVHVRLSCNLESYEELDLLQRYGVDGVGLFRSEYQFLAEDGFPTEEKQFQLYRDLVARAGGPCVIRTFDIGGDKLGDLYPSRVEKNPFLGCRAIRLMLKEKKVFLKQLRAILRASAFGEVRILFPMISGLAELRECKQVLEVAKEELRQQGIAFCEQVSVGCMVEVPSAALIVDLLLRECDFLSIGTNDLVQYLLAVERGNPQMSYLYNPAHPSLIRLLKSVADEAKRAQKPVSVCGEIAADPRFTALLLGLGLCEFSVALPSLSLIRKVIRKTTIKEAESLASSILSIDCAREIESALVEAYSRCM